MTQVADRPTEAKKEVRPGLTDNYTPAANVLIRGFKELSATERFVAIGLVNLFWDEEIHAVSLRELANKLNINYTTLRSHDGKRPTEGILDKLWRIGVIGGLLEGKPTNEMGTKGHIKTYLWVNHHYIAERNQEIASEAKQKREPRYAGGKSNTSQQAQNEQNYGGNPLTSGGKSNDSSDNPNKTVSQSRAKQPPNNNKELSKNPDKKDIPATPVSVETPNQKKGKKQDALEVQTEQPSMPPEDAPWRPGTIAAMFNHWRGHEPLTKSAAVQANTAAGSMYRAGYTREQIAKVYDHMCKQQYWIDQGGVEIWNVANNIKRELNKISGSKPGQTNSKSTPNQQSSNVTILDDERNRRNIEERKQKACEVLKKRVEKGEKFHDYEIVSMVEQHHMSLPEPLMERYRAIKQSKVS